jgi:hypothetical protein
MHRPRSADRISRALARLIRPFAAVTAVALIVASVSSATAAATSVSLKPVADTSVNASAATTNYGSSPSLRIDGSPVWNAYLRFDLSGTTGTVTRAVLQIYPNSASRAGLSVHPVTSTTWGETATTAAKAPAIGSSRVVSGAITAGKTIGLDVTSFVAGHRVVSLALSANDATAINLASRESAHPPVLVLTLASSPTAKPPVTPVAVHTPSPTSTPSVSPSAAPSTDPASAPSAGTSPADPPSGPPTSASPLRAAFYYPWFPEAWNQSGMNPFTHYHPSAGFYNGADAAVVAKQITAMQYGKIQVGIASWWGQGSPTDAKVRMLLSTAAGTGFKWSLYYEPEGTTDPSSSQIASDLAYINGHYGSDPSFYRINGKPVIFVYAQPADGCGMASRWATANASHADYVVLKVFPGYASCATQPDQWHQYSPAVAEDHQAGRSFAISPGFWLATSSVRLARDVTRWQQDVRNMVASREPWQLVTTFNEWGEGTSVESATEWATASGYGAYLDALHNS